MSPNTSFPLHESPQNAITQLVLGHPRVTFHVDPDVLVIAIKDELLVRKASRVDSPRLNDALIKVAIHAGSLGGGTTSKGDDDSETGDESREPPSELLPADEVELWRLTNPDDDSIDQARRLRALAQDECVKTRSGPSSLVPAVSPNHVCVVASWEICPATPPLPCPPIPTPPPFVEPTEDAPTAGVVVIDTGYIYTNPPHATLDARVTVVAGEWFDTTVSPARWRPCPPDVVDTDSEGRLIGVVGHGTFIAGIVAHESRQAQITVVGQRHDCMPLTPNHVDEQRLFSSEFDVASALLNHADADVVSCGFAFPTLDDYASIVFSSVMNVLTSGPYAGVAVVAPAGNESSARPYWPAAHPDVIGVAATNPLGFRRAWFSNWGAWANCCARGQDVRSTFVDWLGPIQGEPLSDIWNFSGWAIWNGTSFATPKVSGAIAKVVAESGVSGVEAYELLISGSAGVTVTPLTDMTLAPFPGVTLPHLHLG